MSWFKNSEDHVFRIRRKRLLGLDIGSSMVKLVELETTSQKLTVNTAAQAPIEVSVDPATRNACVQCCKRSETLPVGQCRQGPQGRMCGWRTTGCRTTICLCFPQAGELPQAVRMEARNPVLLTWTRASSAITWSRNVRPGGR